MVLQLVQPQCLTDKSEIIAIIRICFTVAFNFTHKHALTTEAFSSAKLFYTGNKRNLNKKQFLTIHCSNTLKN